VSTGPEQAGEWTVVRMLEWATGFFREKNIPSPRLSIEWLLAHVLDVKRLDLYLQFDRPLTAEELNRLRPMVKRRSAHEPLQYITGSTDFYNLTLRVEPGVLIPRPETEQLVELMLRDHPGKDGLRLLDVGTGSGCIALAAKKERPGWQVTAIDISSAALKLAGRNASESNLEVQFVEADFSSWQPPEKQHIIISNPPYIPEEEMAGLSKEVAGFEPAWALTAPDIAQVYRDLLRLCRDHLLPGGRFYFEINESHGDKLLFLCNKVPFTCRLEKDYSGKDRFLVGKLEE
jgi:release factor glutamine methyltransferase